MQRTLIKHIRRDKYLLVLLLPGLAWYIIFCYLPMAGLIIAFNDYSLFKGMTESPWVGLANFANVFDSRDFWNVLRNTLLISIYKIAAGFPVPIILSLLINELKSEGFKKGTQLILYLPHFISWVVISGIMQSILSPSFGIFGKICTFFGVEPYNILASSRHFRLLLVVSDIWKGAGWGTIIYLAALSTVNPELYEAATIDGAGRWKKMYYITLPCISGVVVLQFILRMGGIMSAGFEQVLIMQNDIVRPVGEIFDTYVLRKGLQQANYSYTTAVGCFKSVVALIMIYGTNAFAKALGEEGLL